MCFFLVTSCLVVAVQPCMEWIQIKKSSHWWAYGQTATLHDKKTKLFAFFKLLIYFILYLNVPDSLHKTLIVLSTASNLLIYTHLSIHSISTKQLHSQYIFQKMLIKKTPFCVIILPSSKIYIDWDLHNLPLEDRHF